MTVEKGGSGSDVIVSIIVNGNCSEIALRSKEAVESLRLMLDQVLSL